MSVLESFRLDGRVALVTGGAGRYGRQITEAVAEAGARTCIASRNLKSSEGVRDQLRSAGLDVHTYQLDQSDEESVLKLRDRLEQEFGAVDILVNNAVSRPMTSWGDPASAFAQSMNTNATGLFLMTRAFGSAMAERGAGSIVNIGSIHGTIGPDFSLYEGLDWGAAPDYFFHKGGLLQLTRYAAAVLGPRGVRVNAVSPGGFYNGQDEAFVRRYNTRTFIGRLANEHDLKGAVVFLASDASAYITGANLAVDGGYIAK